MAASRRWTRALAIDLAPSITLPQELCADLERLA